MNIMTIPLFLICCGIMIILRNIVTFDEESQDYENLRSIGIIIIALGFALLMIAGIEGAIWGFATVFLPIMFTT